ncbi:VENN motif pre-toxin domain-containing protein [Xanthomonas sacchari]|uniref:VENN motif pre-toxin domain-containing protein n=1 Tax=Xanthomonas sacchari TaxID=56458 RepID=UPI0039C87FE6
MTKTLYGADAKPSDLSEQDKQTILALSQAVGALVGGMTGGRLSDVAVGSAIARNAVENNRMLTDTEINRIKELSKGDVQLQADLTAAACARVKCSAQFADGTPEKAFWGALEAKGAGDEYKQLGDLLAEQIYQDYSSYTAAKTGIPSEKQLFDYDLGDAAKDGVIKWDNSNGHPLARLGGVLQTAAGSAAISTGAAGCAETGISCLLIPWGADQAVAGARTVATGETTSTLGGMLLSKTGLPTPYAEALYSLVGFVPSGVVPGLGRSATTLPITTLEPVNALKPVGEVAEAAGGTTGRTVLRWGDDVSSSNITADVPRGNAIDTSALSGFPELPPGYRNMNSAGAAANETGGLPKGFRRVYDSEGDLVIQGPGGEIYASEEALKTARSSAPLESKGPGSSLVPRQGSVSFESGKTFESLSASEQEGLKAIQNLGYDVYVPLEASKKGVSGVPTAEFNVQGLGMVDVYSPTNLSPVTIAREIEKKVFQGQANSVIVVVPEGFSNVDMYKAAAAAFGKSRGGKSIPLNQVIFSQGGKTIQLDRRAINSLLGGKGG